MMQYFLNYLLPLPCNEFVDKHMLLADKGVQFVLISEDNSSRQLTRNDTLFDQPFKLRVVNSRSQEFLYEITGQDQCIYSIHASSNLSHTPLSYIQIDDHYLMGYHTGYAVNHGMITLVERQANCQ